MIPKRVGNCCQCPKTDTYVTKVGRLLYCILCHRNNKAKQYMAKARERNLVRSLVSSPVNKENAENDKVYKAEMDSFWLHAHKEIAKNPYCIECGEYIPDKKRNAKNELVSTNFYYRGATAHILLKSIFKSVAHNLDNWLKLPASCCHDKTHRLDTFSKMKCFGQAVKQFRKFEHLITEKHNLLDTFRILADEYEEKQFFIKENTQ